MRLKISARIKIPSRETLLRKGWREAILDRRMILHFPDSDYDSFESVISLYALSDVVEVIDSARRRDGSVGYLLEPIECRGACSYWVNSNHLKTLTSEMRNDIASVVNEASKETAHD
jgi:hypothetical protein